MRSQIKQRIIGTLVLLAIVAIFLPVLFHHRQPIQHIKLSEKTPSPPMAPKVSFNIALPDHKKSAKPLQHLTAANTTQVMNSILRQPSPHDAKVVQQTESRDHINSMPKAWVLQVASFSNNDHAKRLAQKLRQLGFDVFMRQSSNGARLVRVYVGPNINRDKLLKIKRQIASKFHLQGVIRRYVS